MVWRVDGNCLHVGLERRGTGGTRSRFGTRRTVDSPTEQLALDSAYSPSARNVELNISPVMWSRRLCGTEQGPSSPSGLKEWHAGVVLHITFGADRSSRHWMMSCGACQRLLPPGVGTAFDRLCGAPSLLRAGD